MDKMTPALAPPYVRLDIHIVECVLHYGLGQAPHEGLHSLDGKTKKDRPMQEVSQPERRSHRTR